MNLYSRIYLGKRNRCDRFVRSPTYICMTKGEKTLL